VIERLIYDALVAGVAYYAAQGTNRFVEADRFNARAVRAARRTPLPRLLTRLARTRARLVRALRRLPPRALADPTHALPVTVWLTEFALTHEQGHRRAIRTWWAGDRRRRPGRA